MAREIHLSTGGLVALVDDIDFDLIAAHCWRPHRGAGRVTYAKATVDGISGVLMHRLILQPPPEMGVDHINWNGLDNQRANLRPCTAAQNAANRRPRSGGTSRFKGVSWSIARRCWRVAVWLNYRVVYYALFETEEAAARAYDHAATQAHGAFAYLNFPNEEGAA